jgi:hypothetical protein
VRVLRIDPDTGIPAAQPDQELESIANPVRLSRPHMVDRARLSPLGQGKEGEGDISHIDEVAAGVEVAHDEFPRVRSWLRERGRDAAEGLRAR